MPPDADRRNPGGLSRQEKSHGRKFASDGQNEVVAGRKRVLTQDLVSEFAANLAAHETLETACAATGVSSRSVRRWRSEGERQLEALTPEARLALELDRVDRERRNSDWRAAARALEQLAPERWGPAGDLDRLLAEFDEE